ncbi:MAG: V4R domain-containing protein [Promethearchaeota archaeon]
MFKRSKKPAQISIDEKKGHLFLSGAKKELRLLMLRPIDLIEFAEFAGANAEDIIIWVGKTVGKYFVENTYPDEDWSGVDLSSKKVVMNNIIDNLIYLGYGQIESKVNKDNILIAVYNPLSEAEKDNIMAKNLCLLYQGIFNGILEALEIDVEGQEIKCYLVGDEACVFKYDLLIDEFDEKDIDPDKQEGKSKVSNFLSTL